jgi:hypothetical protein
LDKFLMAGAMVGALRSTMKGHSAAAREAMGVPKELAMPLSVPRGPAATPMAV